jgi:hypothetical protein
MAEADGAELQRTEQRGTEALALPAIGDRNRKLAASLIAVEGIAAFADDGIPPLPPPFGDQGEPIGLAERRKTIDRDLGEVAGLAHESVVTRRRRQRAEIVAEQVDVADPGASYPDRL